MKRWNLRLSNSRRDAGRYWDDRLKPPSRTSSCDGQFNEPYGIEVDAAGNVYVTDRYNYRIQKFGGPWLEMFIGDPESLSGH